jgi:hypothetical protein
MWRHDEDESTPIVTTESEVSGENEVRPARGSAVR